MRAVLAILMLLWSLQGAGAQELSALARLVPGESRIAADGAGISVDLAISQPVPWRVRLLDQPPRLVLDVREVDWAGLAAVAMTVFRPGWSRLVLELDGPYLVSLSEMQTREDGASIRLGLIPASQAEFAPAAARPEPAGWALPAPADLPQPVAQGTGKVVVVLDPGHGGIDPGAERDGQTEAGPVISCNRPRAGISGCRRGRAAP